MDIDLEQYLLPVDAWSQPELLQRCLSEGTPEVCGWALLTSAARCDDEWVQLLILPFVRTNELFGVSGVHRRPYLAMLLDSETSRQLARSWVDALSKPLPLSVVNAASAKALVSAMRNEGYSSASVSFELFRRYETSIAAGIKYAIVGVSVMGALAALMWFVAESR